MAISRKMTVPCDIGDMAYVVRKYKTGWRVIKGIVAELSISEKRELRVIVRYAGRGVFGDRVFLSQNAADERAEQLAQSEERT